MMEGWPVGLWWLCEGAAALQRLGGFEIRAVSHHGSVGWYCSVVYVYTSSCAARKPRKAVTNPEAAAAASAAASAAAVAAIATANAEEQALITFFRWLQREPSRSRGNQGRMDDENAVSRTPLRVRKAVAHDSHDLWNVCEVGDVSSEKLVAGRGSHRPGISSARCSGCPPQKSDCEPIVSGWPPAVARLKGLPPPCKSEIRVASSLHVLVLEVGAFGGISEFQARDQRWQAGRSHRPEDPGRRGGPGRGLKPNILTDTAESGRLLPARCAVPALWL